MTFPHLRSKVADSRNRRAAEMHPSKSTADLEPLLISISDAARVTGESQWSVKMKLRSGAYKARKSGRRTLIIFETIKTHTAGLPDAKFAPPRERRQRVA